MAYVLYLILPLRCTVPCCVHHSAVPQLAVMCQAVADSHVKVHV